MLQGVCFSAGGRSSDAVLSSTMAYKTGDMATMRMRLTQHLGCHLCELSTSKSSIAHAAKQTSCPLKRAVGSTSGMQKARCQAFHAKLLRRGYQSRAAELAAAALRQLQLPWIPTREEAPQTPVQSCAAAVAHSECATQLLRIGAGMRALQHAAEDSSALQAEGTGVM